MDLTANALNADEFRRLNRREQWVQMNFLVPCLLFLVLFFFVPLAMFLSNAFFDPGFTLEHFEKAFTRPLYMKTLVKTLKLSLTTTIVCVILAYPVAFVITHTSGKVKTAILILVLIPFWTNILVRMFAWLAILGRNGVINSNLIAIGAIDEPISLLYNYFAVVLGMTHYMLPFMILPIYSVMAAIPANLTDAAANLGATPFRAFLRVFLPLSLPGVGAGCLLVFILSLGFFITPALMGGAKDTMFAQIIEIQINQMLNWGFAAALSTILLVLTIILYLIYDRLLGVDRIYGKEGH
ncbi:Spermidine/putrescine transport system permease protein PotB [Roseovarius gaetbuli]|uniref:Spermidine/putrescine transport system permease protein PotB n=1 Tax=Roseovarius gaetbuli TaxID=1356575 RepID=A0A1X7A6Y3_9RHOB|nr:ABC transporter permease [Roseovarius gaetbuli]SLN72188.1 Spermidine/putrescine transport system permease protein PotB [Roseovarius gaetbuli]